MPTCSACGFTERPETGPCPTCGVSHENAPTDIISFPPLPATGLFPGVLLARKYELRKRLGGGGFGIVYLAHDVGLDKDVAVKVLQVSDPGGMDAAEAKKRFLREARALAKLDEHPNIVRVMNVDEDNGVPYFVMEYIAGGTLLDLLKQGRIPPARAASIAADVAAALTSVHTSGVIHRDLKPANVFMKGDRAMLGDFGIAYVAHESTLTVGSGMPGTPMYMSPESLLGKELDGRSDLFSLGCVLYEALAGAVLFKGESVGQVVGKIIDPEEVDLSALHETVPAPLVAVLRRALAKRVADRYPSARFMERDLRVFATESGGPAAAAGARPRLQADPAGLYAAVRAASKGGDPTQLSPGPAKPAGDRRVFILASVAVVLAGATLMIALRSRNDGAVEPPAAAKTGSARSSDAAGAVPPSTGSEIAQPSGVSDNAAPPGIEPQARAAAPPQPPREAPVDIGVQIEGAVHTGTGLTAAVPAAPVAGSAVSGVSSSWAPTRLEDAVAKGFHPPPEGAAGRNGRVASEQPSFLSSEMDPPELIERIEPEYPETARASKEEGKVTLEIVIGKTGEVLAARVVGSQPFFDDAATTAVRLWKFRPARENGRPVKVFATVTLEFKLNSHP